MEIDIVIARVARLKNLPSWSSAGRFFFFFFIWFGDAGNQFLQFVHLHLVAYSILCEWRWKIKRSKECYCSYFICNKGIVFGHFFKFWDANWVQWILRCPVQNYIVLCPLLKIAGGIYSVTKFCYHWVSVHYRGNSCT
jgi:hypothetical protein